MAEEAVLKYLTSTNRPYSANDIVLNLHKQWGKTGVQRALDNLVGASMVLEKVYGKQKVYVIRQKEQEDSIEEELKELDSNIAKSTEEMKQIEDELKVIENELKNMSSTMSIAEINKAKNQLEHQIKDLTKKLEIASSNTTPVSPEKVKKAEQESKMLAKEFRTRKRICMDMVNTVLESYPNSKKALYEEVGIETDEEANFVLPY